MAENSPPRPQKRNATAGVSRWLDFELSTCYHALVLECFLSATLIAVMGDHDFNGENHREIARKYFSEGYFRKLFRMVEFILCSLKPTG